MDDRMYLVNKRTGHVIRLASFRYSDGWFVDPDSMLVDRLNQGFKVSQEFAGEWKPEDWEIGYEDHLDVKRYLNYRHPVGIRN